MDPGILAISVDEAPRPGGDAIRLKDLAPWLTIIEGDVALEHAVLGDGWRRIRLDVVEGTLRDTEIVQIRYHLSGLASLEPKLLPLRRFVALCRRHRFAPSLFPPDRRLPRWIDCLRVADARADGASYREIAAALFGEARTRADWNEPGRSLQSRVRRLVGAARHLAGGGYRTLLQGERVLETSHRAAQDHPP